MVFRGKPCGCWDCNPEGTGEMFLLTRMRHQALKSKRNIDMAIQFKRWNSWKGSSLMFPSKTFNFPCEIAKTMGKKQVRLHSVEEEVDTAEQDKQSVNQTM